ncbi:unnamed protein product [Musa acuminata subsp. malaccensis]|uniref:Glycosyltransferase n=1 Tax=Musa acuminata subsp. malaccensis TaxID=214687 RepID=A0A804ISX1_MUSAM|nr:PREDICTED: cis-zeatin O-glucosyltransferase 2-like isoform X1 [Musa acuminata subsp. malaccensis]CAG1843126.1 unnamed protein product [Musa acuminata subsp. malaccensis]
MDDGREAETNLRGVSVVVLPLPAFGHLNQLLHLARLLSTRGVAVHYAGSATHNRQVRDRASGWRPDATIHFHDFPLPPFASPEPDPRAAVKFPAHLQPAFDAAVHLRHPLAALLRSLAAPSRRVVLIHDSAMSFAAALAASLPGVEAFSFHSVSAFAVLLYLWESCGKQLEDLVVGKLNLAVVTNDGCFTDEFLGFLQSQHQMTGADSGRLLNTCRSIEGPFIDLLKEEPRWREQKTFAVGPLNQTVVADDGTSCRHECLEWLDQQPPSSVVYVSFGTTSSLSDEQVAELAAGLQASGQRFIWVLRDADRADIYADEGISDHASGDKQLPNYDKAVHRTGRVVRGWAPQLDILAHRSTGGFMSHCGWNSCMESLSMGVPILAWPMHSDQPRNTLLVTHILGTGVLVRDWAKRNELTPAMAIRDSILRLMISEEGKDVQRRANAVGQAVRKAMAEGGSSKADLDAFIAYITS